MKVGIIGLGFVGGAVLNSYQNLNIQIISHDPFKKIFANKEELYSCDGIFVCVPSPNDQFGKCDTSILEPVLDDLSNYSGVIISKVTCPPLTYAKLQKKYKNLVHAPEFLVAATAKEDYLNGEFCIIGGEESYSKIAVGIIQQGQKNIKNILFCNIEEASMIKYSINSFLATKVVFMNQIQKICKAINADYNTVVDGIKFDNRIGTSHFQVPGPDGKYGFGGACFPKDTQALEYMAKELNESFTLLEKAIEINKTLRN